jgi:uncharacterized protein YuzB (UPF0349 family)
MSKGIESEKEEHKDYSMDVIEAGNLGYCELFHFVLHL